MVVKRVTVFAELSFDLSSEEEYQELFGNPVSDEVAAEYEATRLQFGHADGLNVDACVTEVQVRGR